MPDGASPTVRRRRLLRTVAAAGLASGLAGCTGGDADDGSEPSTESGADGDEGDGGTDGTTTTESGTASPTAERDTETGADRTTSAADPGPSSGADGVPASVSLTVRGSRSNVGEFETLRTTFEAVELVSTDGSTVRLDGTTTDVDLTALGPGGSVDLLEGTIPPGSYDEAKLYLPIQEAALTDGSDPEFERTVPASREVQSGDPFGVEAGGGVELALTIALLRIAGDGPWTYTLGWGFS